jgi:hypothetical protein
MGECVLKAIAHVQPVAVHANDERGKVRSVPVGPRAPILREEWSSNHLVERCHSFCQ